MENNIAVFVDVENLTFWAKNNGVQNLMSELQPQGHVVIRKAYGQWSSPQLNYLQQEFNLNGFELIQTFHPVSGKNSADIKMTVDAMEQASNLNLQTFVLVSGDSDFSPLFRKLRELGKDVIGVGPHSKLSECVENSCSQYFYTDDKLYADGKEYLSEKEYAFAMLHRILQEQDEPIPLTKLKPLMVRADKTFDLAKLGYKSFKDFILASGNVELSPVIAGPVYASMPKIA